MIDNSNNKNILKIKELLKNKFLVRTVLSFLILLFLIILNNTIKDNIYETTDRSFSAMIYSKIFKLPAIKINKDKILYEDYLKSFDYLKNFYQKQKESISTFVIPSDSQIKKEVEDKMIKNLLIRKLASKYKLEATDRDVYEEIKKLNDQTGSITNTEQFIKDNYGMSTNDFKISFIEPIILKNKLQKSISNDDNINKSQIDKINSIYSELVDPNNQNRTNKLGQKINIFSEIAKNKSEDRNSGENQGDLGWISRDNIDPDLKNIAFSLNQGEISKPIKTIDGYHILKMIDKIDNIDIPKIRLAQIFVKSMNIDTYLKNEMSSAKIKNYIR